MGNPRHQVQKNREEVWSEKVENQIQEGQTMVPKEKTSQGKSGKHDKNQPKLQPDTCVNLYKVVSNGEGF